MDYFERTRKEQAEWYAAQTDGHLMALKSGAWMANNVDGYAKARAEQDRREKGGTFEEHLRIEWH